MSTTWYGDDPPPAMPRPGLVGWMRLSLKAAALALLIFGGLALLLLLRLAERPLFGQNRPVTPYITVFVCRVTLRIIGLRKTSAGRMAPEAQAIVANHSSWLDIFVLNAAGPVYFVSKAEVAKWPGIGWLARATGTVFIERKRGAAAAQSELFTRRLQAGHRLLFFPEGTSSDGTRILPFKTTLFAAFFSDHMRDLKIQPVTLTYRAPEGQDARFYGWWGDMAFGPHLLHVLGAPSHGQVTVTYHDPLKVRDYKDRKTLAQAAEAAVRASAVPR